MKTFFAFTIAGAALLAACSADTGALTDGHGGGGGGHSDGTGPAMGGGGAAPGAGPTTGSALSGGPTPTDTAPAPNTAAKAYFVANVHPSLVQTCGGCHETGPGPAWLSPDAEVSYKMMFQLGYVSTQSRLILKGPHQTTQGLSADQSQKFLQWVQMESASGTSAVGTASPLTKIGACFDRAKFDAMQLGQLRTITRTNDNNANNVQPWRENPDTCTGCKQVPCRNCHSGDDATLFVEAEGNPNLSKDFTFNQSKLTTPAYVTKYFGVSATGQPIASNAIKIKADATAKDHAYSHPYFVVDADLQARIDDFVNSAIAKYTSSNGNCTP